MLATRTAWSRKRTATRSPSRRTDATVRSSRSRPGSSTAVRRPAASATARTAAKLARAPSRVTDAAGLRAPGGRPVRRRFVPGVPHVRGPVGSRRNGDRPIRCRPAAAAGDGPLSAGGPAGTRSGWPGRLGQWPSNAPTLADAMRHGTGLTTPTPRHFRHHRLRISRAAARAYILA